MYELLIKIFKKMYKRGKVDLPIKGAGEAILAISERL